MLVMVDRHSLRSRRRNFFFLQAARYFSFRPKKKQAPATQALLEKNERKQISREVLLTKIWREHNKCVTDIWCDMATRLRSSDLHFRLPGLHQLQKRSKLYDAKWQDSQSQLLSPLTACGVSYLKVRMNNNQLRVLATEKWCLSVLYLLLANIE